MLDNNGFIDKGDIFFNDPDLTVTAVAENSYTKPLIARYEAKLNEMSRAELGAATWREILALEKDHKERLSLNEAEAEVFAAEWRASSSTAAPRPTTRSRPSTASARRPG